jgi:hypothetical protein
VISLKKLIKYSELPGLDILIVVFLIQSLSLVFLDVHTATVIFNWVSIGYVLYILLSNKKLLSRARMLAIMPLLASYRIHDSIGNSGDVPNVLLMVVFTLFRIVIPTMLVLIDKLVSSSKKD